MNVDLIFGKSTDHLVLLEGTRYSVHKQMISDFLRLQNDAKEAGFDLQIISAFRDFDRQLRIWNAKASGERPLLDDNEQVLNYATLSPTQIMYSILRWSAIPGCSRHHWGTDVDIFDAYKQTSDQVKLMPSECYGNGPSAELHSWLDLKIESGTAYNFFRPYSTDRGGIAPERWHISYYPLARRILEFYTFSLFKKNIEMNDFLLKETLLENADMIYHKYLLNIDLPSFSGS